MGGWKCVTVGGGRGGGRGSERGCQHVSSSGSFKRRRAPEFNKEIRALRQRLRRETAKVKRLQEQLAAATGAKGAAREVTAEWLVRLALANPIASGRDLAGVLEDVVGSDVPLVSRATIRKVKDAFVEVIKEMSTDRAAQLLRTASRASAATGSRK